MSFELRMTDDEREVAIKRGAEALAKLLLDIYLDKKRNENGINDD